jgi:HlyD family secretion protein
VEVAAYQARLLTAQAALAETARGARREDVDRARAQLEASEGQVRSAQQLFDRDRTLIATQAIPQADFDNASAQLQTAQANRDAARSALEALLHGSRPEDVAQARARVGEAQAQLENTRAGSRDEDIRASRALLQQAQARLAHAEMNLRETTVVAPRDCVVEALDLRPGDILGPNQPAVTLVEDDQMFVRAYVPETELGLVHVGDRVAFTVDTFGGHPFHAAVQHVNQVGEYNPRNVQTADERANQVFLVRLGISEGREMLRAGMAATVLLPRRHP